MLIPHLTIFLESMTTLGPENVALAGPTPAEAVRIVAQLLLENGFKEQELEIMLKTNPTQLIYP